MKVDLSNYYQILNPVYWDAFENQSRIRVIYGGSGSGKSHFLVQEYLYKVLVHEKFNVLVIRKVSSTHRTSCFALFQQIIYDLGFEKLFKINKTDLTITCIHNKNEIIFKGLDSSEKIKSVTATNGIIVAIFVEEATEITQSDFNQLNIRLRGKSKHKLQITIAFNPISVNHWIYKSFFLNKEYQKSYNVFILKTTYKDNKWLDDDYRIILEGYKDIDVQFYRVYCLAEFGVYGNVIFNNYSLDICPYKEGDFDSEYNGLDFGFIHPQVLIRLGFKDGNLYAYNELCVSEKTNKEYIELNEEFDILHKGEYVTCDSAEPSKIKEWVQYGYGAIPAIKGKDSVTRGIDYLRSQKLIVDPNKCPRLVQELEQYHWKEDKDGNPTDKPVDLFDDAIKACFYALEQLSRSKGKPSVLSGGKSEQKKELISALVEQRKKNREIKKAQAKKLREERQKK